MIPLLLPERALVDVCVGALLIDVSRTVSDGELIQLGLPKTIRQFVMKIIGEE